MVLGLGGHSAFQEATEIISRGSWRLSPPPLPRWKGLHLSPFICEAVCLIHKGLILYEEGDTEYLYKGLILLKKEIQDICTIGLIL